MYSLKNIYLICAPSGAGKTTIVTMLQERYGIKSIQSYTTRKRRTANEEGHIFVTNEEFDALSNLVGYTYFDGNRYCATSEQVENSNLYVIDVSGIHYFHNNYKGIKGVRVIHIECPEEERMRRMELRMDDKEDILRRIANDRIEFSDVKSLADISIENIDYKKCREEVWAYICEQEGFPFEN